MLPISLTFEKFSRLDREALADWLSCETWPFHADPQPSRERVALRIDEGAFDGDEVTTFWVLGAGHEKVGLVRVFDLDDDNPLIDLWIAEVYRGRGAGKRTLAWITGYVFRTYAHVRRIGGNTREDNRAMRKAFGACGYVKEAHYRKAWPTGEGRYVASIGYAILREDWAESKVTGVVWDDGVD
jgi:RimJ/RimL family protein N-acetyltransferase